MYQTSKGKKSFLNVYFLQLKLQGLTGVFQTLKRINGHPCVLVYHICLEVNIQL